MELLIKGILITMSAILDSEKDTIVYNPQKAWFKSDWWLTQNYLVRKLNTPVWKWLVKYPFSFLINGWHLCKSLSLILLFLAIFPLSEWYLVFPAYILYGAVFNLFYDT